MGLVTGTCLADYGNDVYCVDVDANKIENLKEGNIPIYEPGLHVMVQTNYEAGRLKFTTDIQEALINSTDQIYNLACPASPPHYQFDPIKTAKTCFLGALHMLGLAKRCKARILQASTSEVYGDSISTSTT